MNGHLQLARCQMQLARSMKELGFALPGVALGGCRKQCLYGVCSALLHLSFITIC